MSNCVDPLQLELKEPQCAKHIDNHKAQGNIDNNKQSSAMQNATSRASKTSKASKAKPTQSKANKAIKPSKASKSKANC